MPKIDKDWNPGRATQFSSTNQPKGRRGRKPKQVADITADIGRGDPPVIVFGAGVRREGEGR